MKTIQKILAILFTFLMFPIQSFSQGEAAMYYLNFPTTVSSIGLGEQGVASRNNLDALNFNPANLIYTKDIQLTYFSDPMYSYVGQYPLSSFYSTLQIPEIGYFGVEYLNWNLGKFMITSSEGPEIVKIVDAYQRSFSIGYARDFSEEFAAGIQVRYAKDKFTIKEWDKFLFSAGVNYNSDAFDKRLTLGFSLTNFGTAIEYNFEQMTETETKQTDPPPSDMKLGLSFTPIESQFHSINFQFELSKYIIEREGFQGQSAFKSLFTDWQDFPEDVTVHTGFSFEWYPLYLGSGLSFFQKFYLGNRSTGPKSYLTNYYTHAAIIGFAYKRVTISTGYGGWWHNVHSDKYYFPKKLPRETFQFTIGIDPGLLYSGMNESPSMRNLEKIILSAGPSYTIRIGRSKEERFDYRGLKFKNSLCYSIETDFYIDENNALISNFSYQSVPIEISIVDLRPPWTHESKIETFLFSSSYRYHPLETFQPLFIQGGLGIIRGNPVIESYPKYDYRTFITASTGAIIELPANIILIPSVNFTTILSTVKGPAPRLGGYNQFDVSLKLGYQFN